MDTGEQVQDMRVPSSGDSKVSSGSMSDTARIVTLALGDILVFLIFATVGSRSHGEATSPLSVVEIAAPFAIGWFLVAPFVGAFKRGLEMQPRKMAMITAISWIIACPVGLLLRGLFLQRVPPTSFAIVTFITNLAFLLIWRWPFAFTRHLMRK